MNWVLIRLSGGKLLREGGFDVTCTAYHGCNWGLVTNCGNSVCRNEEKHGWRHVISIVVVYGDSVLKILAAALLKGLVGIFLL